MKYEDVEINSKKWLSLDNLLNEEWRDIKGYEGLYQISNYGRVKSIERKLPCNIKNNEFRIKKAVIKKIRYDKDGYCKVMLCKYGVKNGKNNFIHRLVAQAFIPNLNNYNIVNHIDGIKNNNKSYNLEWCTIKENVHHAIRTGLMNPQKNTKYLHTNYGKNNVKSRSVIVYDLNNNYIGEFDCMREAKEKLGLKYPSQTSYIGYCCRGKVKQTYGYIWRYKNDTTL